jgi:hypothetical protein
MSYLQPVAYLLVIPRLNLGSSVLDTVLYITSVPGAYPTNHDSGNSECTPRSNRSFGCGQCQRPKTSD